MPGRRKTTRESINHPFYTPVGQWGDRKDGASDQSYTHPGLLTGRISSRAGALSACW